MSDLFEIDASTAISFGGEYSSASTPPPPPVFSRANRRVSPTTHEDEVALSTVAKAQLWRQEGWTDAEIAAQLGVSVSTVQADLGVVVDTQVTGAKA